MISIRGNLQELGVAEKITKLGIVQAEAYYGARRLRQALAKFEILKRSLGAKAIPAETKDDNGLPLAKSAADLATELIKFVNDGMAWAGSVDLKKTDKKAKAEKAEKLTPEKKAARAESAPKKAPAKKKAEKPVVPPKEKRAKRHDNPHRADAQLATLKAVRETVAVQLLPAENQGQ